MGLAFLLKSLLSILLLPPGNGLALLGLAGLYRRRGWARPLAICAGLLLLLQSLPIVAFLLISPLEQQAGPLREKPPADAAIVVLGSGLSTDAPEYGQDTANERTLIRLRYGAMLARQYGLPVLLTGGRPLQTSLSEAEVMAGILENEFAIKPRWLEKESVDTAENATLSALILKHAGIGKVVLVTQAFHMPRARLLFERAGLQVIAAPTGFNSGNEYRFAASDLLPQASALRVSYYALHEWLGLVWLRLRQ
ncbi:MAG: YdcF family protein [Rhodocyclales bacterium GT-UBC]|nr:MAG: YdcF family protein [Rhodocyclales bacterium GT-UBC]